MREDAERCCSERNDDVSSDRHADISGKHRPHEKRHGRQIESNQYAGHDAE